MADVTLASLDRLVFAANVSVAWLGSAAGVGLEDLLPALDMLPPAAAAAEDTGCSCSSCMRDKHMSGSTGRVSGSSCVTTNLRGDP